MDAVLRAKIMAEGPTKEQENAIFADEREFLLRASPGSGKTWTSCRRYLWRCTNWDHSVGGMAFLSFTNVAVREFKAAVGKVGHPEVIGEPHFVGTVDVFLDRFILGPFGHLSSGTPRRPKLYMGPRPAEKKNGQLFVWDNSSSPAMQVPAWDIVPIYDAAGVKFARRIMSNWKPLPPVAAKAVQTLWESGWYPHEHRGYWAWKLVKERPALARILAARFPEILVDEAQDCNAWILLILQELRNFGTKVTLVGDPDQCIYEFAQADPGQLSRLKQEWGLPEKPLQKSFRCNDAIAAAARPFGTKPTFVGNGTAEPNRKAYFIIDTTSDFAESVANFRKLLGKAKLPEPSGAVLARGKAELSHLRGVANYTKLKGKSLGLAAAVHARDKGARPTLAVEVVTSVLRESSNDDSFWEAVDERPGSPQAQALHLAVWKFVRNVAALPPLSVPAAKWLATVRASLNQLEKDLGLGGTTNFGSTIRSTGLEPSEKDMPLLDTNGNAADTMRAELIHQVKGQTIPAVLVIGTADFWTGAVKATAASTTSERRRLAFVAMTRAEHLLVVGLPAKHAQVHSAKWQSWGFQEYSGSAIPTQGMLFG